MEKNLPVPDESHIVVESGGEGAIINACFGHKTNDTLGRVMTSILSARFGSSIALQIDPYRIELTLPKVLLAEEIEKMILELDPTYVEPILEMTLKNTTLLRWKMVHVARKFGAFSRDVDYQRVSMAKLLAVFEGTPMYREALREIYHDRLDILLAKRVLERIRDGTIAITTSGLSPIGTSGRGGGRDVTSPEHADAAVINLLKNRIMNDRVLLFCVNCKKWKSMRQVERVPEQPECPLMRVTHGGRTQALGGGGDQGGQEAGEEEDRRGETQDKKGLSECQSGVELWQDCRNSPGQPGPGAGDSSAGGGKTAEG